MASKAAVSIGVVWLWLTAAGVLASWLVVWGVAYSAGGAEARARLGRFEASDPANAAVPNLPTPGLRENPTRNADIGSGKSAPPSPPAAAPPQPAAIPAADSRIAGQNYLLCASLLDKASAEAAAGFLTQNGVPATAVPTKGRAGKFSVYTLLGIPGESFNSQLKVRNDHKAQVARLGQQWRKENPGSPDFSDALWDKFTP